MIARGIGAIVNISSMGGVGRRPFAPVAGGTKGRHWQFLNPVLAGRRSEANGIVVTPSRPGRPAPGGGCRRRLRDGWSSWVPATAVGRTADPTDRFAEGDRFLASADRSFTSPGRP